MPTIPNTHMNSSEAISVASVVPCRQELACTYRFGVIEALAGSCLR